MPPQREPFLKGAAISIWQNSGDKTSQWTRYANGRWPLRQVGVPAIRSGHKVSDGPDFWNNYARDLKLAADLGSNSFRFSLEWARIEPGPGVFDMEAVRRYHAMLDCMESHGMEPNATLWHFVHPAWFEDMGGFSREENIPRFVNYCQRCFEWFGDRIRLWATFNEPTGYLFIGWMVGVAPPGWFFNVTGLGATLSGFLKAHTAAYRAMKAMPGGERAQIGFVSHHITFQPRGTSWYYGLSKQVARWLTYWLGSELMTRWMSTGEFEWRVPGLGVWQHWRDPAGRPPCDWWGINYYSRGVVTWYCAPGKFPGEIMTDMPFPIYPEGLYNAIQKYSSFGMPLYITETGIADLRDDRRAHFIDTYMQQILRAVADGYDVRGVYYWTLMDNMEWTQGYHMKFGLYSFVPGSGEEPKLKDGSKTLVRYYKTLPGDMEGLRRVARAAYPSAEGAAVNGARQSGCVVISGEEAEPPAQHRGRLVSAAAKVQVLATSTMTAQCM